MKKYEIPAILNGKRVKFVVSVPDWSSDYQAMLYLIGKYKNDDLVIINSEITEDDIVIISSEITEIVEFDLTKKEN